MIDIASERGSPDESFTAHLYQMDIERIRYSLTRYYRIRIIKIEKYIDYIVNNDEMMNRLSYEEKLLITKLYR